MLCIKTYQNRCVWMQCTKQQKGKRQLTQVNALICWIFNYAWNEQQQQAPILARNLEQGNQWLEDSALENLEVDKDDNIYPPETASHKFVESDGNTSPEEINLKSTSSTSLTIPSAKKQKSTASTTSCNFPNESASVMFNVKGRGRGVGRGRRQQKQNTTVRGRGGRDGQGQV